MQTIQSIDDFLYNEDKSIESDIEMAKEYYSILNKNIYNKVDTFKSFSKENNRCKTNDGQYVDPYYFGIESFKDFAITIWNKIKDIVNKILNFIFKIFKYTTNILENIATKLLMKTTNFDTDKKIGWPAIKDIKVSSTVYCKGVDFGKLVASNNFNIMCAKEKSGYIDNISNIEGNFDKKFIKFTSKDSSLMDISKMGINEFKKLVETCKKDVVSQFYAAPDNQTILYNKLGLKLINDDGSSKETTIEKMFGNWEYLNAILKKLYELPEQKEYTVDIKLKSNPENINLDSERTAIFNLNSQYTTFCLSRINIHNAIICKATLSIAKGIATVGDALIKLKRR